MFTLHKKLNFPAGLIVQIMIYYAEFSEASVTKEREGMTYNNLREIRYVFIITWVFLYIGMSII